MTSARTSLSMLTITFVACAVAACGAKKNGQPADGGEDLGGKPWITASPSGLGLETLCPGDTSAPTALQIYNRGEAAASVQVKITGDEAGEFTASATGCDLLAPGALCTVVVVLTPKPSGDQAAVLEVSSPGSPTLELTLSRSRMSPPVPFILSDSSFDFHSVAVGTVSPATRVTVTKQSSTKEPCSLDGGESRFIVTLSSHEFIITNDTCSTSDVPIGGTCTFDLAFQPIAAGSRGGSLIVGPPWSQKRISVRGTGVAVPDASVRADLEADPDANPDL